MVSIFHSKSKDYLACKLTVSSRIDTLMSISDGLGSSIFCRKRGKARPAREEMDGSAVYIPPESAS